MSRCCNCQRQQIDDDDMLYQLDFTTVRSNEVRAKGSYFFIRMHKAEQNVIEYNLCAECHRYCKRIPKGQQREKFFPWNAFIWKILARGHTTPFHGIMIFHKIYKPEEIWKLIPSTMRRWWVDSIKLIVSRLDNDVPYKNCTMDQPPPMFEDRTKHCQYYETTVHTGTLAEVKRMCNNQEIFMPNVLCPFGCTTYCFEATYADWTYLIQRYLLKTPLATDHSSSMRDKKDQKTMNPQHRRYLNVWKHYFRDRCNYDCHWGNPKWQCLPSIVMLPEGPRALVCPSHEGLDEHQRLYPPRQPDLLLCATTPDELSHVTPNPRFAKPMVASAYCTSFHMAKMQGNYTGIDSLYLRTKSKWKHTSLLRSMHESLSLAGRHDIVQLLQQKVEHKQLSQELATDIMKTSAHHYDHRSLAEYRDGATYVPTEDIYKIHLNQSSDDYYGDKIMYVDNKGESGWIKRQWSRRINTIQMEDSSGYGFPFHSIPTLIDKNLEKTGMMPWALCSLVSSMKDIWALIDCRDNAFWTFDCWEGHLLTLLQKFCFSHQRMASSDKKFSKSPGNLISVVERLYQDTQSQKPWVKEKRGDTQFEPGSDDEFNDGSDYDDIPDESMQDTEVEDMVHDEAMNVFKFSASFMQKLFDPARSKEYNSIVVRETIEDVWGSADVYDEKDFIIIVNQDISSFFDQIGPTFTHELNLSHDGQHNVFELCSIALFKAEFSDFRYTGSTRPNKFEAIRFMRHQGYQNWWKQERSDKVATHMPSFDIKPFLESFVSGYAEEFYTPCMFVYSRDKTFEVDKYKLRILQTMGGEAHIMCRCSNFPLIPSPVAPSAKRKCIKCHDRKEWKVCCSMKCSIRLCKSCYESYSDKEVTFLDADQFKTPGVDFTLQATDRTILQTKENANYNDTDDPDDESAIAKQNSDQDEQYLMLGYDSDGSVPPLSRRHDDDSDSESDSESDSGDEPSVGVPCYLRNEDLDFDHHPDVVEDEDSNSLEENTDEGRAKGGEVHIFDDYLNYIRTDNINCEPYGGVELDLTYGNIDFTHEPNRQDIDPDEAFLMTHAGDELVDVVQNESMDTVSGHVLMNQVAVCTRRFDRKIRGRQRERFFTQHLCSTIPGQACPLLTLDAQLFPSIFWSSASVDNLAILGAIPIWAIGTPTAKHGFASSPDLIRSRTTASGSLTSVNHTYIKHGFDILMNMSLGKGDSRQIISRGFQVDPDSKIGLLKARNDTQSRLTESVDSQTLVRGLSASQEFIKWDLFETFTSNHSLTPGVCFLHDWKQHGEGHNAMYPGYDKLTVYEQSEVRQAIEEASCGLMLRNWAAVRKAYLQNITEQFESSGALVAIFSRDEYQKDKGNLFHEHLVMAIDKTGLGEDANQKIMDLIRTSYMEIIKTEDIQKYVEQGLLNINDIQKWQQLAKTVMSHDTSNPRNFRKVNTKKGAAGLKDRKLHSVRDTPDPLTHQFIPTNFQFSPEFVGIAKKMGLVVDDLSSDEPQFYHSYFRPHRHMAPCNPNATDNMSPCRTEEFLFFASMVNCQYIGSTLSMAKYLLKYVAKHDENNRIEASANVNTGQIKIGEQHLHNTKIESSAYNEKKAVEESRTRDRPAGRAVCMPEIIHMILGIPEVTTNLRWKIISTESFEARSRSKIRLDKKGRILKMRNRRRGDAGLDVRDEHEQDVMMRKLRDDLHSRGCIHRSQLMTYNQCLLMRDDLVSSRRSDTITEYSLRPPELLYVFESISSYFRYCEIDGTSSSNETIEDLLTSDLSTCQWFDGFGRKVRIRKNGLSDVKCILEANLSDFDKNPFLQRSRTEREEHKLFCIAMNQALLDNINLVLSDVTSLTENELVRRASFIENFIFDDKNLLLPIPVLSQINPINVHQFFIHLVLSLGKYETELDALQNGSLRDCLRKVRLIGDSTEQADLEDYVADVVLKYIFRQVIYYPNSLLKTQEFIMRAWNIMEDVILHDSLPALEIPFLMTQLKASTEDKFVKLWIENRDRSLDAIYAELHDSRSYIPRRETIEERTRYMIEDGDEEANQAELPSMLDNVTWDPVSSLRQVNGQSDESFTEQKFAMGVVKQALLDYCDTTRAARSLKSVVVHGAPGSGKTHMACYATLFGHYLGLRVIVTAIQAARASFLGGRHIHKLFHIPVNRNSSNTPPLRLAERAIEKIMRTEGSLHCLLTVDVIFIDECGQLSAELLTTIDIILRILRHSYSRFGGCLVLGTMDHAQLQPINGLPFLMSSLVMTSFTLVELKESVRACDDSKFKEFQDLLRRDPNDLKNDGDARERFEKLMGGDELTGEAGLFDFYDSMKDPRIPRNAVLMFSRREQVKNATQELIVSLEDNLKRNNVPFYKRNSVDSQVRANSNGEYSPAQPSTVTSLNISMREPETLVFHQWGLYEITYNHPQGHFCHTNRALLPVMPDVSRFAKFETLEMLLVPAWVNHIDFLDSDDFSTYPSIQVLIERGYKWIRVGCPIENDSIVRGGFRAKRQQYGLKHPGATTIDKAQGDTIHTKLVIEISGNNVPWLKSQCVVAFSRTKLAMHTAIVGNKKKAIETVWELITKATQWTVMTRRVLKLLTINSEPDEDDPRRNYELDYSDAYPYAINSVILPTDKSGYVYILASRRNKGYTYIGECECISIRFRQHNTGHGATATMDVSNMPWALAGYICGLTESDDRFRLERLLKVYRDRLGPDADIFSIANQARRIVQDYNEHSNNQKIQFHSFIRRVKPAQRGNVSNCNYGSEQNASG